ncbi:MAG: SNF2-related protein, partial [Bacilli bacterium]
GSKFGFHHAYDSFDQKSQLIIDILNEASRGNYPRSSDYTPTRYSNLPFTALDRLYDAFQDSEIYCEQNLIDSNVKPVLYINEEEDYYFIDLDRDERYFPANINAYDVNGHSFIRYKLDEAGLGSNLIRQLLFDGELVISKANAQEFISVVLSRISEYFDFEGIDLLNTVSFEDSINIYGDVNEDLIYFKIECNYENGLVENIIQSTQPLSANAIRVKELFTHYAYKSDQDYFYLNYTIDDTYLFLDEVLPIIKNFTNIFVSEALNNISKPYKPVISVGLKVKSNLLEINIDSVDFDKNELVDILKSYRKKKKFYRLKNGKMFNLDNEELEALDQTISSLNISLKEVDKGKINTPLYRSFMIDEDLKNKGLLKYQPDQKFNKFLDNFKKKDLSDLKIKPNYLKILREYQIFGVQWMYLIASYGFGGILADDMGLGKTLQVIALIDCTKDNLTPSLVVSPASLMLNWDLEIKKFAPHLKVLCINGHLIQRQALIKDLHEYDIVITTYDYLRKDIHILKKETFDYLILDEAQYIKNHHTKAATSVKELKAHKRFALSGTPIENSLAELWSIFDYLMPHYLYSYHHFLNTYEKQIVKHDNQEVNTQLKRLVEPFILRRHKKEVLKDLPDKIEKTMYYSFNEEEKKLYQANLLQANKEFKASLEKEGTPNKIVVLKLLLQLRQLCSEPRLLYQDIKHNSSKLKGCLELLQSLISNGEKTLLFSSFTSVLDLIEPELKKHNISFYRIDGSVKKEQRQQLVQQFQSDQTNVFLISLKAGGTGLNLTAATAIIHFDPWWNISAQNQATDRAYRIGQEKEVNVFKLIMKDSIEEKILSMQKSKQQIADNIIENSTGSLAKMDIAQISELFSE